MDIIHSTIIIQIRGNCFTLLYLEPVSFTDQKMRLALEPRRILRNNIFIFLLYIDADLSLFPTRNNSVPECVIVGVHGLVLDDMFEYNEKRCLPIFMTQFMR